MPLDWLPYSPDIVDAVNPHASVSSSTDLPNVLITTARYEEFFREGSARVESLTSDKTRLTAGSIVGPEGSTSGLW